ncbi:hypothetical protein PR202_ga09192 [Eleusine coracana subsp. coracana]|uniref:NAD-dependent epimerase/dehydratase domain-containing protein n=1 Tax=Eleusine coracana subsp. coracana TaxID=191504 RepID=A0AAV5C1W9_ELECO|nr:hypothetical protein PR202_ga09192 [Eleusine coracana subsp. coracana]
MYMLLKLASECSAVLDTGYPGGDVTNTRLRLFQMDLLDPASIQPPIDGALGVFHLVSPMILEADDTEAIFSAQSTSHVVLIHCTSNFILHAESTNLLPACFCCCQKDLLDPAVKGTLSVLRAAKESGVSRVVLMSSQVAIAPNPNWPADKVIDEDSWADIEWFKKLEFWYGVAKTRAEKASWEFAAEEGLQLVVINPGMVIGSMLTPFLNVSLHLLLQILQGERVDLDDFFIGCVDVRDVVHSLITLYENPSAQGRHLCIESITRLIDFTDKVADMYPESPVQRVQEDKQEWLMRAKDPAKKLIDLGVPFTPIDKTIKDTVDCFRSKALI